MIAFQVPSCRGVVAVVIACWLTGGTGHTADLFMSPQGRGNKDGTSREHALAAGEGGLQKAWDALPAGATLWLAPGEYRDATLGIKPTKETGPRTLAGETAGEKHAVFVSSFDRKRPEKTGAHAISVLAGTSNLTIRGIEFRDVNTAIHLLGGHDKIVIEDVRVIGAREGIRSEGKGKAAGATKRLTVRGCVFEHFTKRGLRLLSGHEDIVVEGCSADAGGREWGTEPFQMGFAVEAGCTEVSFADCVARGAHHDAGKGYWNGDGFCAESGAGTIRWTRCRAFDNTDGGWDTKADLSVFQDCIAARNKRNYRVWGKGCFKNCLSVFPVYPGGSGGTACVWSKGEVALAGCTLVGDCLLEKDDDKGSFALTDCVLVPLPQADGSYADLPAFGTAGDSQLIQSNPEGLAKLFLAPSRSFEKGNGFNRTAKKGPAGYREPEASAPPPAR